MFKTLKQKIILVVIIVLVLILIILLLNNKTEFEITRGNCNPVKIDKCFLLTLPESVERRNSFLESYKSKIPLEIIYGVNTKIKSEAEKYKHLVDSKKYNLMHDFDSGKKSRPDHTYFNSGALGCYLGHMEFYERCFDQNLDYAIIFEDNVVLSDSFNKELESALTRLGDDFDACFFHCWTHIGENVEHCGNQITKLKWVTSTKCYLINVKRMKKYYDLFFPINTHVDLVYEKIVHHGAHIYLIHLKSIVIRITQSTIGHTQTLRNNSFSYLDESENKNIKICNLPIL